MKRPVTPENRSDIYKDKTICKTINPVVVKIEDPRLTRRIFGIDLKHPRELPAGSEVAVFDAQTVNLTGVNDSLSPANAAYRIEGKLSLTVYEGISRELTEKICSNEKLRKHSNLIPVVPPNCDLEEPFPGGTIVSIKESTTFEGVVLPSGRLLVIMSKPKTPRGQMYGHRPKKPIADALYDVILVREKVYEFKVRNPSNMVVLHKDLQRVPQES